MTPGKRAQQQIDLILQQCGWIVQDRFDDLRAAVREAAMKTGGVDSSELILNQLCDFGSQGWRFEPVRVQMAADKQVVYYLSRHLKRKSKFVSQLLASFDVQNAENQCLKGIQNAPFGGFADAPAIMTLPAA